MPTVGFEPIVSAGEWPQTYALDRAATGIGHVLKLVRLIKENMLDFPSSNDRK